MTNNRTIRTLLTGASALGLLWASGTQAQEASTTPDDDANVGAAEERPPAHRC